MLELADQVAALALKAPHLAGKQVFRDAVDRVRKLYGFSDELKRRLVEFAINNGCTTYRDIVGETRLVLPEVINIVQDMSKFGEVDLQSFSTGERGRPTVYIQLTGRSSRRKSSQKGK